MLQYALYKERSASQEPFAWQHISKCHDSSSIGTSCFHSQPSKNMLLTCMFSDAFLCCIRLTMFLERRASHDFPSESRNKSEKWAFFNLVHSLFFCPDAKPYTKSAGEDTLKRARILCFSRYSSASLLGSFLVIFSQTHWIQTTNISSCQQPAPRLPVSCP